MARVDRRPAGRPPGRSGAMTHRVALSLASMLVLALAGCAGPLPPDARVSAAPANETVAAQPAGANQVGEACRYQPERRTPNADISRGFDLFCGSWQQPSARMFQAATPVAAADLPRVAHASAWRAGLDERFSCGEPETTSLLNDASAQLMRCTRHSGNWPQLALVANVGGQTWFIDSVPSALPAVQTALGAISGGTAAPALAAAASSTQISAVIASYRFGSGDLESYFSLLRLGATANDMGDYSAAELAFRNALASQQRLLGPADPGLAVPMMDLALQISNQGRYREADILFARAGELVARQSDRLVEARYTLYLAEHEANRSQFEPAAAKAGQAAAVFADAVPSSIIEAVRGGAAARGNALADSVMLGPEDQRAISGLAASWALEALIAYKTGKFEDSTAKNGDVRTLLRVSGISPPGMVPRAVRVAALSEAGKGDTTDALPQFGTAVDLFNSYQPNGRPVVVTLFLAGKTARAAGDNARALELFRRGAQLARTRHERHDVLAEPLVSEYLSALDDLNKTDGADHQAIAGEMLEASQLIEGNVTGRFAAQALARLSQTDPKVRDLIREIQDADQHLTELGTERDQLTAGEQDPATKDAVAKIDAEIAATQEKRQAADAAAQAASSDYARLIATASSADAVQHVLMPHEGLLSLVIGSKSSFGILVTSDRADEYRIDLTQAQARNSVSELRKSIERQFRDGKAVIPVFDVAAAHRLYETLFSPIDGRLDGLDRLVVAVNGPIASLPLETLVTKEVPAVTDDNYKDVPFLLRRFAISYVPTPQTLVALRQSAKPSAGAQPYVGFGDFRPATARQLAASFPPDRCAADFEGLRGLPPLPGTRKEIETVGETIFHAPHQDIVLGDEFTKAHLARMDLTQFRIVHLATHAFLPTELRCRSEPLIVVSAPRGASNADDAFLGLSDVLALKLDADLVILSACNTAGPGGADSGDSLSGLAKAFFFAGARGLFVTHWTLDDSAGPLLTALALTPSAGHRDSAEDLRQAKLALIDKVGTRPGGTYRFYTHPFAWAPFVLVGDGIRMPAAGKGAAPAS